jgi:hypothetical protein
MSNQKRFLFATVALCAAALASPPGYAQMSHGDKGTPAQGSQNQGGQSMPGMQGMGEHGMKPSQMPGMPGPQSGAGGGGMPMPAAGGMMNCSGMGPASGPQQASMPGMMGMQGGQGMMPMMMMQRQSAEIPSDRIEGRIAFLHAELRITPAQMAAWSDVAAVLRANARRIAEARPAMPPKADMTPLEKADQQERVLAARLDSIRALKPAYAALYASFDDAQKKAANELMAPYLGVP